jgi:hypothetical protein
MMSSNILSLSLKLRCLRCLLRRGAGAAWDGSDSSDQWSFQDIMSMMSISETSFYLRNRQPLSLYTSFGAYCS